jgi:hypothetical protein
VKRATPDGAQVRIIVRDEHTEGPIRFGTVEVVSGERTVFHCLVYRDDTIGLTAHLPLMDDQTLPDGVFDTVAKVVGNLRRRLECSR